MGEAREEKMGKDIEELQNCQKSYLTTKNAIKAATLLVSMFAIAIGWLFSINGSLANQVNRMSSDYVTIQAQLSQIQTDISWIKQTLK